MKKYLSILMAIAMLIPVVSVSASAAEIETQSVAAQVESIESFANSSVEVDEKAMKDLRKQLRNHESKITVNVVIGSLEQDYMKSYCETMMHMAIEHTGDPIEGDYIAYQMSKWSYSCSASSRKGVYNMTINYSITYFTTKSQEKAVNEKINTILDSLELDGKTDYEKICAIYGYLTSHVAYDGTAVDENETLLAHSAYGALCNGKAVCQGYANALYRLLLTEGIDCRIISGLALQKDHAWNIAKIDNKYYCMDSTWDSQRKTYEFLLCSENDFKEHSASAEYKTKQFMASYPISADSLEIDNNLVNVSSIGIVGDVDSDRSVTSADSLKILRISVGLENVDENTRKLADVNGDDSVDSSDALDSLRFSVGLSSYTSVSNYYR